MYIIDLRHSPRRSLTTKRIAERRKITSEGLKTINNHPADCSKFNRRTTERRTDRRRLPDRREKYARIKFTQAEKKLIEDVYLVDLEQTP
ncbi:MAG: hypothetical protein QX196_04895 [Methylococcaceae bacterium]|jgi:hypothetical protein